MVNFIDCKFTHFYQIKIKTKKKNNKNKSTTNIPANG